MRIKTKKFDSDIRREMEEYEGSNVEKDQDISSFWKQKEGRWPNLAWTARGVLSVPASSSSSERVFSTTGMICSKRRARLSNSTIEDLAIINLNHERLIEIRETLKVKQETETNSIKTKLNKCHIEVEPSIGVKSGSGDDDEIKEVLGLTDSEDEYYEDDEAEGKM